MASFDPDHALAIILQAKFNEEAKKERVKEKENLPVPANISVPKSSLVDPEWEVTDPCPDVHGLFLAFNDRFFWGRLLGVEVKWSPQMTSCAGICVYEGRNGLCSVRLSAPLLKLRPRSDLVETLLHEMIHAYLFVTNNNRDRDGHGPEFHKHMNRINKEAGTNITVYHSFHAEVKLYQQHWWRCDGPCQKRPPFFGMVKRAKNRAPGPNDFWWGDHQAACGGRFVKIREPEGYGMKGSKRKEHKASNPSEGKDIRNFFKKPNKVIGGGPSPSASTSSRPLSSNSLFGGKVGSNVFGFKNFGSNSKPHSSTSNKPSDHAPNRVVGFENISSEGSKSLSKIPKRTSGIGHVLGGGSGNGKGKTPPTSSRPTGGVLAFRGGGTLVVSGTKNKRTSKTDDSSPSPNTKLRIDNFKAFSGSGITLGGSLTNNDRSRSRLLSIGSDSKNKKLKTDDENKMKHRFSAGNMNNNNEKEDICKCSVCDESMPRKEIEGHLENCEGLKNIFNNSCIVDDSDFEEISEINKKSEIISCPVCALNVEGDINTHLDFCFSASGLLNVFDEPENQFNDELDAASGLFDEPTMVNINPDSPIYIPDDTQELSPIEISDSDSPNTMGNRNIQKTSDDSDLEIIESENRVACMICGLRFGESRINAHVNECLDSQYD